MNWIWSWIFDQPEAGHEKGRVQFELLNIVDDALIGNVKSATGTNDTGLAIIVAEAKTFVVVDVGDQSCDSHLWL